MEQEPAQRLAARLRQFMKQSGTTQSQAAAALRMSQSAFSRRYLGYVELRGSEISTLAALFEISVAEFVGTDSPAVGEVPA